VLTSGNHGEIAKWRHEQSLAITEARRPELHAAWLERNPPKAPRRRR